MNLLPIKGTFHKLVETIKLLVAKNIENFRLFFNECKLCYQKKYNLSPIFF